ncbi:hypothetical protein DL96DRAFT_1583663 [Flagelloscypha sp. PMI_526]|nr:hypothetical protein DL96DRAFT_1583663 [Flagelloscypha sp. PMI_526]
MSSAPDMSWKSRGLRYLQAGWNGQAGQRQSPSQGLQGWREWAGDKLSSVRGGGNSNALNEERIALFPGWAARRYHNTKHANSTEGAFSVDIFVSGFASSHRPPEFATRSQKAFMKLAKSFAALPKVAADAMDPENAESFDTPQLTKSTEDLLEGVNLPPRPNEMTKDMELEALERQFQKANQQSSVEDIPGTSGTPTTPSSFGSIPSQSSDSLSRPDSQTGMASAIGADLRQLHSNLENRLQPFWSSVISSRTVQLYIFASEAAAKTYRSVRMSGSLPSPDQVEPPLASQKVTTQVDGSFQTLFRLGWERLCQHPGALHIAFGDTVTQEGHEHNFYVVAELMPPPPPPQSEVTYNTYQPRVQRQSPTSQQKPNPDQPTSVAVHATPLTFSRLRVLSDIDDTVKIANVLSGTRSIFHTVFVKDFSESIIPGMGEWYMDLWLHGARFHYVSNGPFEILPVVLEFFQLSNLPPGSIKLRSYAGRSLFQGLLTAPAARKRASVIDILNAFPESQFILVGDAGEQDLELYTEIASEREGQILGIFIRDVEAEAGVLPDPTGELAKDENFRNQVLFPQQQGSNTSRPASIVTSSSAGPRTPNSQRSWSDYLPGRSKPSTPTSWATNAHEEEEDYFSDEKNHRVTSEPEAIPSMSIPRSRPKSIVGVEGVARPRPEKIDGVGDIPRPRSAVELPYGQDASNGNAGGGQNARSLRRNELQNRLWRARVVLRDDIILRLFQHPDECKDEVATMMQERGL